MSRSWTRHLLVRAAFPLLCCLGALVSCAKDPVRVDRNRPPQTFLVAAPAESAQASYRIHLYWRGEDPDGYVAGFLWSWDDSSIGAYRFTTKTDSIFELTVNDSATLFGGSGQTQPGQVKAHTFFIRAVDNLGKADPRPSIFNRRIYNASTEKPSVRFVGSVPSGAEVDTICDNTPLTICWTGSDVDGYVSYYRWDVGVFSSPLQTDTCATFNDPNTPGSVPLISGVYTVTVTAVDNAFARSDPGSGGRSLIVVNYDPDTWLLDAASAPSADNAVGHYIQHYQDGNLVNIRGTFAEGDTVPFRSTVWWEWTGRDRDCELAPGEGPPYGITGYAAVLRGTRNGGDPYIIGFRDFLCVAANGDTVRFTTNDPDKVANECGFTDLVLDSLDAGHNMVFNVASRDRAGRADGTPASFTFNCNFPPRAVSFTVEPDSLPGLGRVLRFRWEGKDPEDGITKGAELFLDDQERSTTNQFEQEKVIPESQFKLYSGSNPHNVSLRVIDRAGYYSEETLSVTFNVQYP